MATAKSKPTSAKKSAPIAAKTQQTVASPSELQLKAFEGAVKLFSAQRFAEARAIFTEVAKGPAFDVAQRGRQYIQVCDRRLSTQAPELHTADDHYNYAVERLNSRDLEKARQHLAAALKLEPGGEHILYTLGICCGLLGDGNAAYENLKRAIEMEPRNRVHARQDSDFAGAVERFPNLRTLLEH